MKTLRRAIALILLSIFVLGGSGCMNHTDMESEIRDYLHAKHGESFTVLQLTDEFSGRDGHLLRAVCRSESIPDPFVLYVYEQAEMGEETATIAGKSYGVKDIYPNVRLQRAYAAYLRELIGEAVFVGCTVETMGRCYTAEEVNAGLEACAQIAETRAFVAAYVISDSPESGEPMFLRVKDTLSALPFYRQYLYFGRSVESESTWEARFEENYSRFDSFFMRGGAVEQPVTFKLPVD